jgi:putative phosphoribosyl transferase
MHIQFKDRIVAANLLGEIIKSKVKKLEKEDTLVLGIPRAGALTADILCKKLLIPHFELIIPRKLTDPINKEHSIGAVMEDGYKLLDPDLLKNIDDQMDYLSNEIELQVKEIKRRKNTYYKDGENHDIKDILTRYKTIILVDDGAATGYTVTVAANWTALSNMVNNGRLRNLVIALPIAPKNVFNMIKKGYDVDINVLVSPSASSFHSVEQYHQNFEPVTDDNVIKIMKERNLC